MAVKHVIESWFVVAFIRSTSSDGSIEKSSVNKQIKEDGLIGAVLERFVCTHDLSSASVLVPDFRTVSGTCECHATSRERSAFDIRGSSSAQ